jgi:small subunit ribosomal protein S6
MLKRRYETTYIIDGSLENDKIEEIVKRVQDLITQAEGVIIEEKHWGKRRLTYEINTRQYGYYVVFNFEAPGSVVEALEKFFRMNQNILRYLTIHFPKEKLKLIALDEERKRREEEKVMEVTQTVNKTEE